MTSISPSNPLCAWLGSALSPDFVTDGRALILAGKPGRGKTRLAIAIAYRAIQNGFDALFFITAAELIYEFPWPSAAASSGALSLGIRISMYWLSTRCYLTCGTDAANILFPTVNDRHRHKRAMIFTTDEPLAAWVESAR